MFDQEIRPQTLAGPPSCLPLVRRIPSSNNHSAVRGSGFSCATCTEDLEPFLRHGSGTWPSRLGRTCFLFYYDEEGYISSKLPMISLQQRVRRFASFRQFSRWTRLWAKLWTLWTFTVSSQSWSTILCGSTTAAMGLTMFDLYFHPIWW